MIIEFVEKWDEKKDELKKVFLESHPDGYEDILKTLISVVINPDQKDYLPCNSNIKTVDFGDYEGTLIFVVPSYDAYPSDFWTTTVGYGSCSLCDTLQSITDNSDYDEDGNELKPTEKQAEDYLTLALHMLQNMKEI
jgi:hypothetical protein